MRAVGRILAALAAGVVYLIGAFLVAAAVAAFIFGGVLGGIFIIACMSPLLSAVSEHIGTHWSRRKANE